MVLIQFGCNDLIEKTEYVFVQVIVKDSNSYDDQADAESCGN